MSGKASNFPKSDFSCVTILTYDKITHIVDEFIFKSADVTVDFHMWQANPFQEAREISFGTWQIACYLSRISKLLLNNITALIDDCKFW